MHIWNSYDFCFILGFLYNMLKVVINMRLMTIFYTFSKMKTTKNVIILILKKLNLRIN
jgi:hypothetical protein